jgi:hypothetical protein
MRAVLCPVCNGKGKIPKKKEYKILKKECHGCKGKGWVEVRECQPVYPYPEPWYPRPYDPNPYPPWYDQPWTTTWETGDDYSLTTYGTS